MTKSCSDKLVERAPGERMASEVRSFMSQLAIANWWRTYGESSQKVLGLTRHGQIASHHSEFSCSRNMKNTLTRHSEVHHSSGERAQKSMLCLWV
ncbi:hypothetical protein QL285_057551 [Trifolium repens]|nr:hypothetical protein QL285_057551 [Trifolium repens]